MIQSERFADTGPHCQRCGALLPPQAGSGRRRQYCPPPRGCKQAQWRKMHPSLPPLALEEQQAALRNDDMVLRNRPRHEQIKPFLKYPGAKWRLSAWIVSYFPAHRHYLEPFAGSAACFFAKEPAPHEVLNDLSGGLTRVFRVIRDDGLELAKRIEMTPWSEEEYAFCVHHYQESSGDEIEDARRFLVMSWMTHGVKFDVSAGFKHNGLKGHVYPAHLWRDLPERLLAVVNRLKDAEIRNRPALEMIAYYNDPTCLIYADPPYPRDTRTGGRLYRYEMTLEQHAEMLDALVLHEGPVVLSSYDHPLYRTKLHHWQCVTAPSIAEYGNHRTEFLWLNQVASVHQQLPLFELP